MTTIVQGIVIGQRVIRDTDVFVSLYTKKKGKLELLAKGAKKISSKLKSHLETLNQVEIMMATGRRGLKLAACRSLYVYPAVKKDFVKTVLALTLMEVAYWLIEQNEPDERIYNLFQSWFDWLENNHLPQSSDKQQLLVGLAAWRLLVYLGYGPQVFNCVRCRCRIRPDSHSFSVSSGGLVCDNCSEVLTASQVSLTVVKVWRFFLGSDNLLQSFKDVARMNIPSQELVELNKITKEFVEYTMGRSLKSLSLLVD